MGFKSPQEDLKGMMTTFAATPAKGEYACNYLPDIVYACHEGRSLTLQIIKPEYDGRKYPCILYVKGSSWQKQKLYKNIPKLCQIAQKGFVVAQIEYREGNYANMVEDTKTAIRFMKKEADKYGVDKSKIGLFGDSSGGHIALMSVIEKDNYNGVLYPEEDSSVAAVADFYGVTDLISLAKDYGMTAEYAEGFLTANLFPYADKDIYTAAVNASPINHISDDLDIPPVLVVHGDRDSIVPFNQSTEFVKVMQKHKKQVYFYRVVGAEHDIGVWNEERSEILANFFNSQFINIK